MHRKPCITPARYRQYPHGGESHTMDGWAKLLGIKVSTFRTRLRRYGADDPRTYRRRVDSKADQALYEWRGRSLTLGGWADELGVRYGTMYHRLYTFGPDDPRTFHTGKLRGGRRPAAHHTETVAGAFAGVGRAVTVVDDEERAERLAVLDGYLEAFPWLGSNSPHLRAEGRAVCASICRVLGHLSTEEVGHIFGVRRQRIDQISEVALKKMKLAGGAELREAWEYAQANRPTGLADWIEQGALGGVA